MILCNQILLEVALEKINCFGGARADFMHRSMLEILLINIKRGHMGSLNFDHPLQFWLLVIQGFFFFQGWYGYPTPLFHCVSSKLPLFNFNYSSLVNFPSPLQQLIIWIMQVMKKSSVGWKKSFLKSAVITKLGGFVASCVNEWDNK